jgi:dienelactone hydrolase
MPKSPGFWSVQGRVDHQMCRICAVTVTVIAFVSMFCVASAFAAGVRNIETTPLAAGPFPVACSDVAYDSNKVNQMGGSPADYWEGNPQDMMPRYFTDILLEPQDTLQINPFVPDDLSFYVQTWNRTVPFVVIVCYPTDPGNTRPDYPLRESQAVPKMQRAGQQPIFPPMVIVPPGQDDPNLLPFLVFSHGLAGSPLDRHSLEMMTKLASFGYIVAAPFHGDARFSLIQIDDIGDLLSVLHGFDQFVEMEALRPLSLKATADAMLAHPDFGPRINPQKMGGFGASMGGAAMTWLLGASITTGFVSYKSHPTVRDPRIKAAVGYVPFAGVSFLPAFGDGNATANNVNTPYLAINGTADIVAPMYRMEQAMNLFQNSHYMVALSGVPHGYDSSYSDDVFGWAIPFLDAYVKGDTRALSSFVQQKNIVGGLRDKVVIDFTAPSWGVVVDCLFDWVERIYAPYFSPPATSQTANPWYFRHYSAMNMYLGTSSTNNRLYYLDAAGLHDVGLVADWLTLAGCRV